MATKRCGESLRSLAACSGCMAVNQGKLRATPLPRNTVRRSRAGRKQDLVISHLLKKVGLVTTASNSDRSPCWPSAV